MIQLDVIQGEQNWHDARAKYRRTASLAPAVMGSSKKKTRTEAIAFLAIGIEKEFSVWVQEKLIDRGHLIEGYAMPIAEKIIGKKLYPVTAISDDEYLLASYDGLSADDEDSWECKSWNDKKAEDVRAGIVPEEDFWQVVQQLAIGAKRCLYMVTDGTEERTEYCWLLREEVEEEIERLITGWNQADKDVENYQHVEIAEKPKAEAILNLPALSVQATGMVTYSNLPEFKAAAESYISNINTDLQTDQQFADAEATVKFCKTTEETLEVTKKAILAQTSTIDEVIRTVDHIQEQLRDKRLMLDKLVKSEKENRKASIVQAARMQFNDFVLELEAETKPIRLTMAMPVFADAIKGLKKLSAMQEAVDNMLRDGKFDAEQVAKDVRAKLAWCKENASGMSFLFPDLQQIISKQMDDFTLTISSRIKAHQEAEVERIRAHQEEAVNAERARIRAEEEAKARAKVEVEAQVNAVAQPAQAVQALTGSQPQEAGMTAPNSNVVVIEHQDVISAFMASRDFGKDAGKVRAAIVEFVKFEAQFSSKKVAA